MKALDTNILVYAKDSSSDEHSAAIRVLRELAEGSRPWAIPWPCIYEFLRVVTHSEVLGSPMSIEDAVLDVIELRRSPTLILLSETTQHLGVMKELLETTPVTGNHVHDAHIAALCIEHGVDEIVTHDNDFRRFRQLKVTDPF